jgi:NADPH-dependent 2,4-dienoyl-CoA reductase/sulfur reductase-like enzyme/rhodanese-related sulfurtransferase
MKVVIIGAVAGGATAAARLRRLNEDAEIILLEKGQYISFANCGLPYYIGGEIQSRDELLLQTPQSFYKRFRIDVRVLSEAIKIDRERKTVKIRNLADKSEYEESYDRLIYSPGAKPIVPPIKGIDRGNVFTVRNIPDTDRINEFITENSPEKAVIIGGGYIGIEMAENLYNRGLKVTIIEKAPHVIGSLDFDIACEVHKVLREKGIDLILGEGAEEIYTDEKGQTVLRTSNCTIITDMIILSVGVTPDTALAEDCGLALSPNKAVIVNKNMQTSDGNIYAVGDCVTVENLVTGVPSHIPLAGPANKQGRIAADNICSVKSEYKGSIGSAILKLFDVTVASCGINERAAKAAGLDYDKLILYPLSHAGYFPGAENISMKVLFENKTGRILGAQLVGRKGVDKRCDILAVAIRQGLTAYDLQELELCYAPPYSSAKDPVNMAGFSIVNILEGLVKQYHWHDVDSLPRDGSVTLLDVRTEGEYIRGRIDGTVNIPLDSLRDRLHELDKTKPVYVNCQSGLRSYIACRILSQNGFDCYNLAGGYRLYSAVTNEAERALKPALECGLSLN